MSGKIREENIFSDFFFQVSVGKFENQRPAAVQREIRIKYEHIFRLLYLFLIRTLFLLLCI